jgi:hypothetical protein
MTTTDRGELIGGIVGNTEMLFLAERWQLRTAELGALPGQSPGAARKKKAAGETAALIVLRL